MRPSRRFLEATRFCLTRDEADFLTDRLHDVAPIEPVFASSPAPALRRTRASVWTHPLRSDWSAVNRALVGHAERFSAPLHGAALLYNLMLSELAAAQDGEAST